jgi:opacity protein-like surface antigen
MKSLALAIAALTFGKGSAFNDVLIYGTAGGAFADSHYTALINGLPGGGSGYFDSDRWGYAAGAGVEWAFMPLERQDRIHALRLRDIESASYRSRR